VIIKQNFGVAAGGNRKKGIFVFRHRKRVRIAGWQQHLRVGAGRNDATSAALIVIFEGRNSKWVSNADYLTFFIVAVF
jgi:hypothetical protein